MFYIFNEILILILFIFWKFKNKSLILKYFRKILLIRNFIYTLNKFSNKGILKNSMPTNRYKSL